MLQYWTMRIIVDDEMLFIIKCDKKKETIYEMHRKWSATFGQWHRYTSWLPSFTEFRLELKSACCSLRGHWVSLFHFAWLRLAPLPWSSAASQLPSTHNIYTIIWKWQLFENSPWLSDIKSDFSRAECLARGMAADSRTMQQAWY